MDNLGDWLYIVLLVAAGISGLISSGKKKKQINQPPQPPAYNPENEEQPTESKGFWEIFEEIQKEQTQPNKSQSVPQDVIFEKKKKTQKRSSQSSSTSFQEKVKTCKGSTFAESSMHIEHSDDAFSLSPESFHNTEELRKAIIYSEILNRKY